MKRCPNCKSTDLVEAKHSQSLRLGPHVFIGELPARRCSSCKEELLPGPRLEAFEREVESVIVQNGLWSPETFRFCRKGIGLPAKDLAELLGVAAETISRWENGHQPIDRNAYALLGSLVADYQAGRSDTADRLRALAHPRKMPKQIEIRAA